MNIQGRSSFMVELERGFGHLLLMMKRHSAQRLGAGKNGILTYERKPKCELKNIKQINDSWHAYTIYEE